MREILFEGKTKDSGKRIKGYYLKYKGKSYICETPEKCVETYSSDGEVLGFDGFFEVDHKTLRKYTDDMED